MKGVRMGRAGPWPKGKVLLSQFAEVPQKIKYEEMPGQGCK